MTKEVEMKDADTKPKDDKDKDKKEEETKEKEKEKVVKPNAPIKDVRIALSLLEQYLQEKEMRHMTRVLRATTKVRSKLTPQLIKRFMGEALTDKDPLHEEFAKYLVVDEAAAAAAPSSAMEIDSDKKDDKDAEKTEEVEEDEGEIPPPRTGPVPAEVQAYVHLLVVLLLVDQRRIDELFALTSSFVAFCQANPRRTMCPLQARALFYLSRAYELTNRLQDVRSQLLAAHRTACLQRDEFGQATLLNLLLRNYLEYNLYDQADKLFSKTAFSDTASNSQSARYLYYQGRIKAIQLDYTKAYQALVQAIRKAPQTGALGFRRTVNKLLVIVQLLTGDIPERSIFLQKGFQAALKPYLAITQAVRVGDLIAFKREMEANSDTFKADRTYTLIIRLRQNVIKAGLRKISLSYSRISLTDIASRLALESVEDAECIVSKAIHDGVIDAVIDHADQSVQSKENQDLYSTHEPQNAFHKRTVFCLDIHNEAVRAMRYPEKKRHDWETDQERKERLQAELELQESLEEEDDF